MMNAELLNYVLFFCFLYFFMVSLFFLYISMRSKTMVELWHIHKCVNTLVVGKVVEKHFEFCKDMKYIFDDWNGTCYKNRNYK